MGRRRSHATQAIVEFACQGEVLTAIGLFAAVNGVGDVESHIAGVGPAAKSFEMKLAVTDDETAAASVES